MKFLLMVLGKQSDYDEMAAAERGEEAPGSRWKQQDVRLMYEFMGAVNEDLASSGELVDAVGLPEPAQARLVTGLQDGKPTFSDERYGALHEVMAGFWIVDCASPERAHEIAGRIAQCPVPDGVQDYPVVVQAIPDQGSSQES